jgi:hypothetical protein
MTGTHRAGVHEDCLVRRHLKLENLNPAGAEAICRDIDELIGVDQMSLDEKASMLSVDYDAGRLNIDLIEEIVRKHGADVAGGWWTRFRESWYRFTDENVRDNARREPWSCHRLPPGK